MTSSIKRTKKQILIDEVFKPSPEGYSEWVKKEDLGALDWGKNGAQRHGVFFGDKRYNWEKQTTGRAISAVRTTGFNEDILKGAERPIRADIHKYHKSMGCVVCGSKSDLVTDHKNDLYNDTRVLTETTQTVDDFQCLCNHCNLQKRQVSKKTKETMTRYPATKIPALAVFGIDFIEGNATLDLKDPNAMVGTYWYDPVAFMKAVKAKLSSTPSL